MVVIKIGISIHQIHCYQAYEKKKRMMMIDTCSIYKPPSDSGTIRFDNTICGKGSR